MPQLLSQGQYKTVHLSYVLFECFRELGGLRDIASLYRSPLDSPQLINTLIVSCGIVSSHLTTTDTKKVPESFV